MDRDERGRRAYEGLMGVRAEEAFDDVRRISSQMYETVLDGAFGRVGRALCGHSGDRGEAMADARGAVLAALDRSGALG